MTRVQAWQHELLGGALTPDDVEELSQHLLQSLLELLGQGLSEDEAWLVATHRLGTQPVLEEEFKKVRSPRMDTRPGLLLLWGATGGLLGPALLVHLPALLFRFGQRALPGAESFPLVAATYSFAALLLVLALGAWWQGPRLGAWLSQRLLRASPVGLGLYLLLGLVATALMAWTVRSFNGQVAQQATDTLVVSLYLPVLLGTVWGTVRQRLAGGHSLPVLRHQLTGASVCLLGLMTQTLVQYTWSFQSVAGPVLVALPLYGLLGWLVGPTPAGLRNLVLAQLPAGLLCGFGLVVNEAAQGHFLLGYGAVLLGLGVGYWSGRPKSPTRVTA